VASRRSLFELPLKLARLVRIEAGREIGASNDPHRVELATQEAHRMLAERGMDVSYETVRRWVGKFGGAYARELRRRRGKPSPRWHLDEMVVRIGGEHLFWWRAVDDEGEVLDILVPAATRQKGRHSAVYNLFNRQRHLISRRTLRIYRARAMATWRIVTAAAWDTSALAFISPSPDNVTTTDSPHLDVGYSII